MDGLSDRRVLSKQAETPSLGLFLVVLILPQKPTLEMSFLTVLNQSIPVMSMSPCDSVAELSI